MADTTTTQAALFDFVEQWTEDVRAGRPRPLPEYLVRFPGHESAIAREYLRLLDPADPSWHPSTPAAGTPELQDLLASLRTPRVVAQRYEASVEVARGGMGSIVRARDRDLQRDVAMKRLLGRGPHGVARFLEEAQVTGQLQHPGVVPVHDLGIDDEGRVFFTMRLVEGRDLREVIDLVHAQATGWSLARALEVLLKVCDTMAFAHARGVVHRDLKPANVRVGDYGEVYVMDWGLALVRGGATASRVPADTAESAVKEERLAESPLLTREGDVLGTPSYMAPEQAEGRTREVGPQADVYALGAMLYHLLAGRPPYTARDEVPSSDAVLDRVRRGPPEPVHAEHPGAPAELVSICEKAMARDAGARYPSLREMGEDLRAHLESRVVRAHRTGAWAELAKWVARNRALAASLALAAVLASGFLITADVLATKSRDRLQLLADAHAATDLLARARTIAPSGPDEVVPLERWLADARDLASRREVYERELAALRGHALPFDGNNPDEKAAQRRRDARIDYMRRVRDLYRAELVQMERTGERSSELLTREQVQEKLASFEGNLETAESKPLERFSWTFADSEDQLRFDTLTSLLPGMAALLDTAGADGWITRMQRRVESARILERQTLADARGTWEAAIASIRDAATCPAYRTLPGIRPQIGLIPLRRDPESGLWEFLHAQSGAAPTVGPDGRWILSEATGIVLVLIPGGPFAVGAQSADPAAPNYDPAAKLEESALIDGVRAAFPGILEPYFLSKYEVTQSQWRRLSGHDPSFYGVISNREFATTGTHPVESVSWWEADQVLRQFGLKLPSEARWEYGARSGTSSPWWTGTDRESLRGAANLADLRSVACRHVDASDRADWPDLDDGFAVHAPVGSFRANAFGLFDVCGNVSEWCSDPGFVTYDLWTESHFGDLERTIAGTGLRVRRGGSFQFRAASARSAAREIAGPDDVRFDTGMRPARDLDR